VLPHVAHAVAARRFEVGGGGRGQGGGRTGPGRVLVGARLALGFVRRAGVVDVADLQALAAGRVGPFKPVSKTVARCLAVKTTAFVCAAFVSRTQNEQEIR